VFELRAVVRLADSVEIGWLGFFSF
jgi:hypothetical protein